jgi:tetratricopeptide (TPR) repeat protein
VVGSAIGRYRLISRIGRGGYATVWRAQDPLLGRSVAIKVLNEELASSPIAQRRFLHEAQSAAALDHPGIVAIYDSGESDGAVYIALSLIDGETPSDRAGRRLLPFEEAVRIVADAADALDHAHQRGVIHRDVTGRNIMIARDDRVIVLDFGLARASWESRLTSTQTTLGTAPYMAPEVMRGAEADVRSDLYGLGTVLYEALTGTLPFPGGQAQTWFYLVMNTDPVPLHTYRPEAPAALEAVVMKAIARDPDLRYQTAAEFRSALLALPLGAQSRAAAGNIEPRVNGAATGSPSPAPAVAARDVPPGAPTYLAVLPFDALGGSADPEGACGMLASRLAESIAGSLARAPSLRVVPPSRAPHSDDAQQVAHQLGANVLLTGSVRRVGSQLRVEFSIRDPWRGLQIGGSVIDGSALQVFDLEDRVVASIARELRIDRHAEPAAHRTADPAAHEHYLQALGYLRRFDNEASVDGAIRMLERLIASEGDVAIYHAALARGFLHKHEHTKAHVWEGRAATAGERASASEPGRYEVMIAIGALRNATGQYDEAALEFERALEREPDGFDALLGLARAHRGAGHLDQAERIAGRAIAVCPEDWRGHLMLGWVHYRAGDHSRALVPWRRVLELVPDNALGWRYVGAALHGLDRYDEAAEAFRRSLAIQPNDEAFSNLGATLFYLGRYEESIEVLRKAVHLTPTDPWRWGNLGNACRLVPGHREESEAAHDRAIGLMTEQLDRNPHEARWWGLMATWMAFRGRREQASRAIRKALEISPDDSQCMVRAGHVFFHLDDREECLRWFLAARNAGYTTEELRRNPELAPLREDPRFREILAGGSGSRPSEPGPDRPP